MAQRPYTSNLLGTIKSHLAGLQGYDVMALELIQNADDAKAKEIIFNITEQELVVWNSGEFTYCKQLDNSSCPLSESDDSYSCDFHRIVDVASGGKLSHPENIGRFGIGFVSTYQITDHPEIYSSGLKVILIPEKANVNYEDLKPEEVEKGTKFVLPWAFDPSQTRKALRISPVTRNHIDNRLAEGFKEALRRSLFFLRHINKAELKQNGELIFGCELDRSADSKLIITFYPSKDFECWYILRAYLPDKALELIHDQYPTLKGLKRNPHVTVAIRTDPKPLEKEEGYLYAYLPTEQTTGLPLHINADFFPEADRKAIIFSGEQHEQAWNEKLIFVAAWILTQNLEKLRDRIGYTQLWEIISKAFNLTQGGKNYPSCFSKFWEHFQTEIRRQNACIALTVDEKPEHPSSLIMPPAGLESSQIEVLKSLGARLTHEELRRHRNVLLQLGTKELNFERLLSLMESTLPPTSSTPVPAEKFNSFYIPLWKIIDNLMPEPNSAAKSNQELILKLKELPAIANWEGCPTSIEFCYALPGLLRPEKIAKIFPTLWLAHEDLKSTRKIYSLLTDLDLTRAKFEIRNNIENVNNFNKDSLQIFYRLLADLDEFTNNDKNTYEELRSLPIWMTGKGLVTADRAFLPGDFVDPTGQTNLIDPELFDLKVREFVQSKLRIQSQTIETYVRTFIPQIFANISSLDLSVYQRLITELADHRILIDDDSLRNLLAGLQLVPTVAREWARPSDTYYYTEGLVTMLGNNKKLWIDESRLPSKRSVKSFLKNIGIREVPSVEHLVERICQLARDYKPNDDAKKASEQAFYALCRRYGHYKDEWKNNTTIQQKLYQLKSTCCLPADNDQQVWYKPSDLHVFYRSEGFWSQAKILAFRDPRHLDNDLLKKIGILMEPSTEIVVDHLLYCIKNNEPAHPTVYQILNEHSNDSAIQRLVNQNCIYLSGLKKYVRPNQLYWSKLNLGDYAFTIPESLGSYRNLFRSLGAKNEPTSKDYVDILIDIVSVIPVKPIVNSDREAYSICLRGIVAGEDKLSEEDWKKLKDSHAVLNLLGYPCYPDEILLNDSNWHAEFFQGSLDHLLCRFDIEYWRFLEKLGVEKLSEYAQIKLEHFEGSEITEEKVSNKLREREKIIAMLLQDKFTSVRRMILEPLKTIIASSYNTIRIQATVQIGSDLYPAQPISVAAFYDQITNALILKRPINERNWVHIFNALLHQLAPNEAASEISKLASHLALLMPLSIEEAIDQLTSAGIPLLPDEEIGSVKGLDQDLGGLGDPDRKPDGDPDENSPRTRKTKDNKQKQKWDEQLLSYVRRLKEQGDDMTDPDKQHTHNLVVERAARKIVCRYERARNRTPEKMPQTHPGYDIISRDPSTDLILRYIEVKGIDGEWNKTGVGVSRPQFSLAQKVENKYWLYVVEHALDPDNYRIYPIQNPASKVNKFMYDNGWREAVTDEPADPTAGFVPGAKVIDSTGRDGIIVELRTAGESKWLIVDFRYGGARSIPFNINTIKLIDQGDD